MHPLLDIIEGMIMEGTEKDAERDRITATLYRVIPKITRDPDKPVIVQKPEGFDAASMEQGFDAFMSAVR